MNWPHTFFPKDMPREQATKIMAQIKKNDKLEVSQRLVRNAEMKRRSEVQR